MIIYRIPTAFIAMIVIIAASNYLVQFPINDWLTFGSFTYPASFLVTELTNRLHGPKNARKVVFAGFVFATLLSIWLANPKIAMASGTAFLVSQLLDISIFNRLRQGRWWYAPFFASFFASVVDTALFWTIAFWGESIPLLTWIIGDFSVKLIVDIVMLTPFRLVINRGKKLILKPY